jgi:hypothetical protein
MNSHASGEEADCTAMNAVKLMARPEQVLPSLLGMLNSLADALPPPDLCERTMELVDQDRLEESLARKAS